RRAGNPHAAFRGSWRRVTASGDPVGEAVRLPPIPILPGNRGVHFRDVISFPRAPKNLEF
ncbi:MAG: hypothetical protein ACREX9_07135, partial [Gammaproteobacteria bacterium]